MSISMETAYIVCSRIAGVWVILSSAERLATLREIRPGGILDPRVNAVSGMGGVTSVVCGRVGTLHYVLLLTRLTAGVVLLVSPAFLVVIGTWPVVAITTLIAGRLVTYGGEDGSDQMLTIMSVAFAVVLPLGLSDERIAKAGLYFVGAQACLAYSAAGVAKLISHDWRSGVAIRGILSTRTYGLRRAAMIVQKHPVLAWCLATSTILLESMFLFAPMLPSTALVVLLVVAAAFHASTAVAMGLNGFFWAFVATYPAIIFLNESVRGWLL